MPDVSTIRRAKTTALSRSRSMTASGAFQYSPHVYYNEHCIVFNGAHTHEDRTGNVCQIRLIFVGNCSRNGFLKSNADLPIVGGLILSHVIIFRADITRLRWQKRRLNRNLRWKASRMWEAGIVKFPYVSSADPFQESRPPD